MDAADISSLANLVLRTIWTCTQGRQHALYPRNPRPLGLSALWMIFGILSEYLFVQPLDDLLVASCPMGGGSQYVQLWGLHECAANS